MHYDRISLPQTAHNALQPKDHNYMCDIHKFPGQSDSILEQQTKISSTINCKVKIIAQTSLHLPDISDFEFLVATGLPSSKKTFLDKVCIYTLQLVDSSISPGWLFSVHVQCSAETVTHSDLPADTTTSRQEFWTSRGSTLLKKQLALKWEKADIPPKLDAKEFISHIRFRYNSCIK